MCGRFALTADLEQLQERFAFHAAHLAYKPRYNIAPSQTVLAVVTDKEDTTRQARLFRWGLIPGWAKDPAIGNRMINARAETIAEKPSFRRALQHRRCLILADGFYEWRKEGKRKTPLFVTLTTRDPFSFAGLWETWRSATGETVHSCTIITTAPNALMATIHHRMPVMLTREGEAQWLEHPEEPQTLLPLLQPYPADAMQAYPVSQLVNSPKNNSSECIMPIE